MSEVLKRVLCKHPEGREGKHRENMVWTEGFLPQRETRAFSFLLLFGLLVLIPVPGFRGQIMHSTSM